METLLRAPANAQPRPDVTCPRWQQAVLEHFSTYAVEDLLAFRLRLWTLIDHAQTDYQRVQQSLHRHVADTITLLLDAHALVYDTAPTRRRA